jgi:hypothetical protein
MTTEQRIMPFPQQNNGFHISPTTPDDLRKAWTAHAPPRKFNVLCATIIEAPTVLPVGIPTVGSWRRRAWLEPA